MNDHLKIHKTLEQTITGYVNGFTRFDTKETVEFWYEFLLERGVTQSTLVEMFSQLYDAFELEFDTDFINSVDEVLDERD